jgi:hypothetical protein
VVSSASVAFASSESGSLFQCSVDSGAYTTCAPIYTFASLANGSHTVSIRAVDLAGNTDPTPVMILFVVNVPVVTPPSGGVGGGSSSFFTPPATLSGNPLPTTPPTIQIQVLPTQVWLKPVTTTPGNQPIYDLTRRVTEFVCPQVVQVYAENQLLAKDIPSDFSDDVKAVMMFRGLEFNEPK